MSHPSLWDVETLRRTDWEQFWTVGEEGELAAVATERAWEWPLVEARLLGVRRALEEGSGAVWIRGLDLSGWSVEEAEAVWLKIGKTLGTPLSQSAEGELVFGVRDAGLAEEDPRVRGPNTRKQLSFHTDRCDVIGFLCLQPAMRGGENQVVSSMAVYERIRQTRPDLLSVLMSPFFFLRHTVDEGNESPWCEQPVFSFFEGHFASAFLRVLMDRAAADPRLPDLTAKQREALDYMGEVAAAPGMAVTFLQEKGDMLFLNNWVTYHRRSEFVDADAVDLKRHILRLWLAVPNSRPLAPCFAANYGATAAGAIRGGMKPRE